MIVHAVVLLGAGVAAVGIVGLTIAVAVGVVSRRVFGAPMAWVVDISGPVLLVITFLGAAYVARQDGHARLAVLDAYLSPRWLRILSIVGDSIVILIIIALGFVSARQAIADFAKGIEIPGFVALPRWTVMAVIPLGCLMIAAQCILDLASKLRSPSATDDARQTAGS